MMKSYPGSDAPWLRHTIRVTLQYKHLVGHIAYWHHSNMCGLKVLPADVDELFDGALAGVLVENDCQFREGANGIFFTLHSEDGRQEIEIGTDFDELSHFVVALEIVEAEAFELAGDDRDV